MGVCSPDGTTLAVGDIQGYVHVFDARRLTKVCNGRDVDLLDV